jgi:hypothetical protein
VIAGYVVSGVGYGLAAVAAMTSGFSNETHWLMVPWVGPWLTLGLREYRECDAREGSETDPASEDESTDLACVGEVFAIMGLVVDGILQGIGGALLASGYLATRPRLERQEFGFTVLPLRVQAGYGLSAVGTF